MLIQHCHKCNKVCRFVGLYGELHAHPVFGGDPDKLICTACHTEILREMRSLPSLAYLCGEGLPSAPKHRVDPTVPPDQIQIRDKGIVAAVVNIPEEPS